MLDELRAHDAILLGAIGDPSVPSGVLERGLLLRLRFELDHHVNLRPARLYPGVSSPLAGNPDIDFVVVREGTEGPYTGTGGAIRVGTPHEIATEVSVNTAFGVERVVRDAFARAAAAPQAPDAGAQDQCADVRGRLWSRTVAGGRRRSTPTSRSPTSTSTPRRSTWSPIPGRFDVIVTDNLFGDIITDLAAAVSRRHRARRQRQHRRHPDATRRCSSRCTAARPTSPGQGIADPTAAIMSVALLLSHVGEDDAAARVDKAVEQHLATRGDARLSTTQVGDRIAAGL